MKLSEASSEERVGFARKVYGVVGAQVGMTALICLLAMASESVLEVLLSPALLFLSMCTTIVLAVVFCCSKTARSKVPTNFGLLGLFTLCEGHSVAVICSAYERDTVILALILTAGVFFVLTGYAMTSSTDFTSAWKIMLTLLITSLFLSIVRIFFFSESMQLVMCFFGVISTSFYILYDTQMIFGGKRRAFDIDDYILAALNIYLDLVILFIKLLNLLQKLKGKDDKKSKK
jgi:FtsH-binding integral membrane protein